MLMKGLRDVEAVVLSCPDADPEKTTLHWTHDLVPAGVAPVDDKGLLFADAFSATNILASLFVMKSSSESCMFRRDAMTTDPPMCRRGFEWPRKGFRLIRMKTKSLIE